MYKTAAAAAVVVVVLVLVLVVVFIVDLLTVNLPLWLPCGEVKV